MRLLSSHVTAKPLHNRCDGPRVAGAHYGQRPKNVFNNKADFKVLLSDFAQWARNGPPTGSARILRAQPGRRSRMTTRGRRSGSGRRAAADYAVAQPLPARRRLAHAAQCRAPLPAARRGGRQATAALPCTNFLGKTLTYAEIGRLVDARRGRAAAARRQEGNQGRAVPAQLADLHRLLLRRAEGRRHGRQLQPALHGQRARRTRSRTATPRSW